MHNTSVLVMMLAAIIFPLSVLGSIINKHNQVINLCERSKTEISVSVKAM